MKFNKKIMMRTKIIVGFFVLDVLVMFLLWAGYSTAETIVNTAIAEDAAIIGLSALMTTTMMKMKEVVALCKEKQCSSKIMICGACITESFAEEIGADGYAKDAAEGVVLVKELLNI